MWYLLEETERRWLIFISVSFYKSLISVYPGDIMVIGPGNTSWQSHYNTSPGQKVIFKLGKKCVGYLAKYQIQLVWLYIYFTPHCAVQTLGQNYSLHFRQAGLITLQAQTSPTTKPSLVLSLSCRNRKDRRCFGTANFRMPIFHIMVRGTKRGVECQPVKYWLQRTVFVNTENISQTSPLSLNIIYILCF